MVAAVLAGLAACGNVSVPPAVDGAPTGDDGGDDEGGDDQSGDDDGSPPDAAPIPDARPPTCDDGITQLLVNPGFEEATQEGAIGWSEISMEDQHLTFPEDQLPISIEEGNRAAWLGRAFADDQRLSQRVTVPAEASALTLSYTFCFVTEEQDDDTYDTVIISLRDAGGGQIGPPLGEFSNLDAVDQDEPCFWDDTLVEIDDSHAGEEITLELRAITDGGTLTSFYFDAMALEATAPCPDAGP
jgi:hypothetical protein